MVADDTATGGAGKLRKDFPVVGLELPQVN